LAEGFGTLAPLLGFFEELYERSPSCNFIVPDITLIDGRLQPHCIWSPRKMSQSKFLELVRGLLAAAGLQPSIAETTSYKTLRRFMPTLGEALGFDEPDAQSIGNWIEVPKGAFKRTSRASHPTSRTYAGDKDSTALINKLKALVAVHLAVGKAESSGCTAVPSEGSFWQPEAMTWSTLRAIGPSLRQAAKLAAGEEPWSTGMSHRPLTGADAWLSDVAQTNPVGILGTRPMSTTVAHVPLPVGLASATPTIAVAGTPSHRSASEASTGELSEADPEAEEAEVVEDQEEADVYQEDLSPPPAFKLELDAPAHLQASIAEDGSLVPFCRDKPFRRKPVLEDLDLSTARASGGWCKNCLARMPPALALFFAPAS